MSLRVVFLAMLELHAAGGIAQIAARSLAGPVEEAGCEVGLPWNELPTVMVPIVVTEMEPEFAAVVVPIAVFDAVMAVSISFVGLCRTLEAGESKQAETGRAREREELRTHWELLSMRPGLGGCPTLQARTVRKHASVCTDAGPPVTNLRGRKSPSSVCGDAAACVQCRSANPAR
jgi:hypothetical protein